MRKLLGVMILGLCVAAFTVDGPSDFMKKICDRFLLKMVTYPQEKVYLQTDKSHYMAGEKIWFRAYLVNAVTHTPSKESRYVYVELTDRQDSVVQRVKVVKKDSVFQGYLPLSMEIAQGDYMIRAYSYAMQNVGEDYLFKKQIKVLNPRSSQTEGSSGIATENEKREQVVAATTLEKPYDIEVCFFPEGGDLLAGNLQLVAFKAVDNRGMPVKVSGVVENTSGDTVTYLVTQHDGMGRMKLPVYSGMRYTARVTADNGFSKQVELPEVKEEGVGIRLMQNDSVVKYAVFKSKEGVLPSDLYVMVHTRGFVYAVLPVSEYPVGTIAVEDMLEGITQLVLFDSQCRILSQRLCFVKRPDKPELKLRTDQKEYSHRELANLEIGFEESERSSLEGSFSVSVVSDEKVNGAILHTNILTDLLLTSDLKGYIESPDYYFDETVPLADRYLDLVMLTHGWTRFDVEKEMKGEVEPAEYCVEKGQVLAGQVKSFSGKKASLAQLVILSSAGHVQMVNADSSGQFMLEGIQYYDSTSFAIQATKQSGRRNVEVIMEKDQFLPVSNFYPYYPDAEEREADFLSRYGQNYYYEHGEKVYLLEEALVRRKVWDNYDNPIEARYTARLDSSAISGMRNLSIQQIIERLGHGIQVEGNCVTRFGKDTLAVMINDWPIMDFNELIQLQAEYVYSVNLIPEYDAVIYYGDWVKEYLGQKLKHTGGLLYITVDPAHRVTRPDHPSLAAFMPLGIQRPAAFYAPKYDREIPDSQKYERDERSTVYWNPVVNISKDSTARISFYTADLRGTYTVLVEGVTTGGEVLRKELKMKMK